MIPHSFQPSGSVSLGCSWFPEQIRIPGKNGEATPRTIYFQPRSLVSQSHSRGSNLTDLPVDPRSVVHGRNTHALKQEGSPRTPARLSKSPCQPGCLLDWMEAVSLPDTANARFAREAGLLQNKGRLGTSGKWVVGLVTHIPW